MQYGTGIQAEMSLALLSPQSAAVPLFYIRYHRSRNFTTGTPILYIPVTIIYKWQTTRRHLVASQAYSPDHKRPLML